MKVAAVATRLERVLDFLAFGHEAKRREVARTARRLARAEKGAARAVRDLDAVRTALAVSVASAVRTSERMASTSIPPEAMTTIRPPSLFDLEEFAKDIDK